MGKQSKIEWTDHTFNPWIGCTKVSAACANCYAERQDNRHHWTPDGWGKGKPRKRTSEDYWKQPLRWNAVAAASGVRQSVFCASLADWLDDEVPIEWLADLLQLINRTPNLRWLLLTKRPENFVDRLLGAHCYMVNSVEGYDGWIHLWALGYQELKNVWLGVTVENNFQLQRVSQMWDSFMPRPLSAPPLWRQKIFLSCEPLLEKLEMRFLLNTGGIGWVIAGGESGPQARPSHLDWFRSLRDHCAEVNVPFFFKQWGDWIDQDQEVPYQCALGERTHAASGLGIARQNFLWRDQRVSRRVGKGAAGNLLDGVRHQEFPW